MSENQAEPQPKQLSSFGDLVALIREVAKEHELSYLEALQTQQLWDEIVLFQQQLAMKRNQEEQRIIAERSRKFGVKPVRM